MDAKKNPFREKEAFAMLDGIDDLYATKGKRVVHFNLAREKPAPDEIAAVLLGPTGNLRAPALRKGKTLLIGFDPETFEQVLK